MKRKVVTPFFITLVQYLKNNDKSEPYTAYDIAQALDVAPGKVSSYLTPLSSLGYVTKDTNRPARWSTKLKLRNSSPESIKTQVWKHRGKVNESYKKRQNDGGLDTHNKKYLGILKLRILREITKLTGRNKRKFLSTTLSNRLPDISKGTISSRLTKSAKAGLIRHIGEKDSGEWQVTNKFFVEKQKGRFEVILSVGALHSKMDLSKEGQRQISLALKLLRQGIAMILAK